MACTLGEVAPTSSLCSRTTTSRDTRAAGDAAPGGQEQGGQEAAPHQSSRRWGAQDRSSAIPPRRAARSQDRALHSHPPQRVSTTPIWMPLVLFTMKLLKFKNQ